jgi:hypothetical protein
MPKPRPPEYYEKKRASYKKDWMPGRKLELREEVSTVEWRGWLFEEGTGNKGSDREVGMGWCNKGKHYISWHLRHGHLEKCGWRNSKFYGH